ncbi:MAG: UTP--glucose-1-phosphate uridylyltransferase [Chlamydiota bacterium]
MTYLGDETAVDLELLSEQRRVLQEPPSTTEGEYSFYNAYDSIGSHSWQKKGHNLLREGKVGCIIMAGGQGSRLGFNGPKGKFPISPIKKKTLFQIFAEKTLAASIQAGCDLSIAIMTSPANHQETVEFFEEHSFWGLKPCQVDFFQQATLPFLDEGGSLLWENSHSIAKGPDGNGGVFKVFCEAGLDDVWKQKGVEYINIIQIDNPLADPFDAELVGYHCTQGSQVTLKAILRDDPREKVGVVVESPKGLRVVEYSELPLEVANNPTPTPANAGMFCLTMDFLDLCAKNYNKMPYHLAWKKALCKGVETMAWKFEKFIFDILPLAQQVGCLVYPRKKCFAPLKNKSGSDSIETVQKALIQRDREIIKEVSGCLVKEEVLELSQKFYYPTPDIQQSWKNKIPNAGYVL